MNAITGFSRQSGYSGGSIPLFIVSEYFGIFGSRGSSVYISSSGILRVK